MFEEGLENFGNEEGHLDCRGGCGSLPLYDGTFTRSCSKLARLLGHFYFCPSLRLRGGKVVRWRRGNTENERKGGGKGGGRILGGGEFVIAVYAQQIGLSCLLAED